jgi:hypothetical protein
MLLLTFLSGAKLSISRWMVGSEKCKACVKIDNLESFLVMQAKQNAPLEFGIVIDGQK